MDAIDENETTSDIRVSQDAIIETVAEAILNEAKPVPVVGKDDTIVGVLHRRSIIHVLFGKDDV